MIPLSYAMGPARYQRWRHRRAQRVALHATLRAVFAHLHIIALAMSGVGIAAVRAAEQFEQATAKLAVALRGPE